jgi:mannose-6-phosphate isomerase-like protein (cupin superfamily)
MPSGGIDNRRLVTGLNAAGRSCVILDGAPKAHVAGGRGSALAVVWETFQAPAINSGEDDPTLGFIDAGVPRVAPGGSRFILFSLAGRASLGADAPPPLMHASDTIDYVVMLEGEAVLILEEGEVVLRRGDVLVDRGVIHAWDNRGEETALLAVVVIDAVPLGSAPATAKRM